MEELLKLLGFTTPLIYATAAYGLFHWLDENASDEAKAALARTMSLKEYKREQIASALVEVFDRIYTSPLLRWRPLFRSFLFTTSVTAVFLFEVGGPTQPPNLGFWEFLIGLLILLLLNVLTDYLSLFVIRPVLVRSGTKPVIGLVLGSAAGAAIVLGAHVLRALVMLLLFTEMAYEVGSGTFAGYMETEFRFHELYYLWPATIVFAWLPLFALGIVIARLLSPLSWIVGKTQWFLKGGKEHPLKAIGYAAALAVFVSIVAGRAILNA